MVLLMACSLAACGGGGSSSSEEPAETSSEKDSVTIQLVAEPSDLNAVTNGTVEVGYLVDQIYGKLVTIGEDGQPAPELAESWEFNDEYTQLTMHLRDGIKFSDGSDITSADVKYSFSTENAKTNTYMSRIESIDTPDDKTVVLNLSVPYSSQINALADYNCSIYPEGSQEEVDPGEGATAYSGPYVLESWDKGKGITLTANPNWYEADSVVIKTVNYTFIGDQNSALLALESGEADLGLMGAPANIIEQVEEGGQLATTDIQNAVIWELMPSFDMPQLADDNVRHAIDCALDRADILAAARSGKPAGNYFAIETFGDDYVAGYEDKPRDLDKAKEYMAQSAYPDGFDVQLTTDAADVDMCTVIQTQLADIGINVTLDEVDNETLVDKVITNGNFEMSFMTYANMINDLSGFAAMHEPGNMLHMNHDPDTTVNDMLGECYTMSGEERHAQAEKIAAYCDEHLPYFGVYWLDNRFVHSKDLNVGVITAAGYDCAKMHW